MADKPILFSAPMVRAILAGRKTQTRRIVKPELASAFDTPRGQEDVDAGYPFVETENDGFVSAVKLCKHGQHGDHLWVRETWAAHSMYDKIKPSLIPSDAMIHYPADGYITDWAMGPDHFRKNRPSIFIPRWASRITLEITNVRVERLQDISEDDADAECFGGDYPGNVLPDLFPGDSERWSHLSMPECFARLWESINGADSWKSNPWVWCISFKPIIANINSLPKAA